LQYDEPTIDIMLKFREQLKDAKYIFVIGYSFKDEHITKIFQNAARTENDFVLFLISPSAHTIYNSSLKYQTDDEFRDPSSSGITPSTSDLEGRVIRLPYSLKIVDLLKDKYLDNLIKGQHCEVEREIQIEHSLDKELERRRWHECLLPYIECEYIDKVEEIIKQKIGWDELLMNRDYRLGCEIIVRSLLNVLPMESERKKYIPISPQNLEVKVENDKVYALFRLIGQGLWHCDDALNFYNRLLDIYRKHPVFCNRVDLISIENGEEIIKQVCSYLSDVWKKPLEEYIALRKEKYENELQSAESHPDKLNQILTEIERKVLGECLMV